MKLYMIRVKNEDKLCFEHTDGKLYALSALGINCSDMNELLKKPIILS